MLSHTLIWLNKLLLYKIKSMKMCVLMHLHVFVTVNCSVVEVGRLCVQLQGDCWGVVREAIEKEVD